MKTNQLKAGVVLSYISLFLGNAISIIYTPVMLRLLGQSEYGLFQLVASIVSYLGLLSFGFGSAYIRYYSKLKANGDNEHIARLNGMFIAVFIAIGLVAMVAGGVLVLKTSDMFQAKLSTEEIEKARILMSILVFNIAISFPLSIFSSYITANEQFIFQRIVDLINKIASPFIILPVLLLGFKSVGLVVSTTALSIISAIINCVYCIRKLNMHFCFKHLDFCLLKEIALFSSFILVNMIVDQVNWNVDKFLLGIYKGTVAVAIYGLAGQINLYYMSFSTSISSVFIPRVNQLVAKAVDNEELTSLFTRVGRIQYIILSLVLSGIIFFGRPFISIWAGSDYQDSYLILLVLAIPVTIPLIQNLGIEIQRAKNLHKFRSLLYLGIAVLNIVLSIPLCKLYGGLGCAIGTSVALLLGNGLIMNIYYHKIIGLNMMFFWSEILRCVPALILPILYGVILSQYINLYDAVSFVFGVITYTIVFSLSMWLFGLNSYEKNLFKEPALRLLKKLKMAKQ